MMKTIAQSILGSLFLLLVVSSGFAQTTVVKTDVYGLFSVTSRKSIAVERSLGKKFSISLAAEHQNFANGDANGQEVYLTTVTGLIPEVRFYPIQKRFDAPFGMFVGTAFRIGRFNESYNPAGVEVKGNILNYGLIGGYKYSFDRLSFEVLTGYGLGSTSGFNASERDQIDPFFSDDTLELMKSNFRFEISVGFTLFGHKEK